MITLEYKTIKYARQDSYYYRKMTDKEREEMLKILKIPETYNFRNFTKTSTQKSSDHNFYIPEKWDYT